MTKQIPLILAGAMLAAGQTQVDLRTQSKGVDFQSAPYTKPLKAGSFLPPNCSVGEVFLWLGAIPGASIAVCAPNNTWTAQGGVTVANDGTIVGSRNLLNLVPGYGLATISMDTGSQVNVQQVADSAVLLTIANHQSGRALLCVSGSGSASSYSCGMTPALGAYATGMVLHWVPDVSSTGGPVTLNVDTLGARPVKQWDGSTDPGAGEVSAGRMAAVWYDGSSFRLMGPPSRVLAGSPAPACQAGMRGMLWHYAAPSGTKDQVSVCVKNAADGYVWQALY